MKIARPKIGIYQTVLAGYAIALTLGYAAPSCAADFSYEDCVLSGVKGTVSETAARLVVNACQRKQAAAQERIAAQRDEAEGPLISLVEDPVDLTPTVASTASGTWSVLFTNQSGKLITYITLHVKDADYYAFKPPLRPQRPTKPLTFLERFGSGSAEPVPATDDQLRARWELERTHGFGYSLKLLPGKSVALQFKLSGAGCFVEQTGYRAREVRFLDRFTDQAPIADPTDTAMFGS